MEKDNSNIYQILGQLQGSLTALNTTVISGFGSFSKDISNLRNDIMRVSKEQDVLREEMRKELSDKVDNLEKAKSYDDGAKAELKHHAQLQGGIWGAVWGAIATGGIAALQYVIQFLLTHK